MPPKIYRIIISTQLVKITKQAKIISKRKQMATSDNVHLGKFVIS